MASRQHSQWGYSVSQLGWENTGTGGSNSSKEEKLETQKLNSAKFTMLVIHNTLSLPVGTSLNLNNLNTYEGVHFVLTLVETRTSDTKTVLAICFI